jgi:hypothetical protein
MYRREKERIMYYLGRDITAAVGKLPLSLIAIGKTGVVEE